MIETICNPDVMLIIFSFLSKKDLNNYDTAQTNHIARVRFLHCLEHIGEYLKMSSCQWTYTRKIWRSYENLSILSLKYISPNCRSLFVSTSNLSPNNQKKIPWNYHSKSTINEIILKNNTIEKLHIDYGGYQNFHYLRGIESSSLKSLTLVNVVCCDDVFIKENIIATCPNLKEIRVINNYMLSMAERCKKIMIYSIGDTKIIKK